MAKKIKRVTYGLFKNRKIVVKDPLDGDEEEKFKWTKIVQFHSDKGYLKVTMNTDGSISVWSPSGFTISPVGGSGGEYRMNIKIGTNEREED